MANEEQDLAMEDTEYGRRTEERAPGLVAKMEAHPVWEERPAPSAHLAVFDLNRMQAELDRNLPEALRTLAGMIEAGTVNAGTADVVASCMGVRQTGPERVRFRVTVRCDAPVRLEVRV